MNVAIAGYGVEGKSSYQYYLSRGDTVTILDERERVDDLPADVTSILGPKAFENLANFDVVVRTPSLSPEKLQSAQKIWSATNEFFAQCPAPIIGVTGTKGKGTTTSLIASILKQAGKTVHVVGNIGVPALEELAHITSNDIVVYELSSFQLWDLETSPHVAVVLMVEPDHLNIHADFKDYVEAKGNIARYQHEDDVLIYHPSNKESAYIATLSPATRKLRYLTPPAASINGTNIVIEDQIICAVDAVGLLGEYNLQNIAAAVTASWQFTHDKEAIAIAVREFKGLEHRLEFVAEKQGIKFYNDSFSSAPTATMAAITAFTQPVVLIVGGYERGIDLLPLAERISRTGVVKHVIVIGEIRERLSAMLKRVGFEHFEITDETDMAKIVARATSHAATGDVVLFSPGCASFDMFDNFTQRGHAFKQAVKELNG